MKKLYILLFLPLLYYYGCMGGCSTNCGTECRELIYGKYYYTISDSNDTKLIEGVINLSDIDGEKIGGTYSKDKIYNDDFPGYKSMQGFFSGNVDVKEKKGFINTNPKLADNNILLNFEIKKDTLVGKWTYSTMRGIVGRGSFYAVKVKF